MGPPVTRVAAFVLIIPLFAGEIIKILVKQGDAIKVGDVLVTFEATKEEEIIREKMVRRELTLDTEVLIIGGGPGGYAAAFRAADLGLEVTMVDKGERPGGECLFRGCIPSKTFLYLAQLLHDARRVETIGISFCGTRN